MGQNDRIGPAAPSEPERRSGSVGGVSGGAVVIDELFDAAGAAAMVELCERFGAYRMYAELEQLDTDIGRGLSQRHDSIVNFIRTGGRLGLDEPPKALAVRTSYFREEYAYGTNVRIDGIEPFLHHEAFVDAARKVYGREVIEPAIAYANLMVPGQELAVHTDVPEFRGCNRKVMPQWLLVVMLHSGLFEEWRMPIATGIAWFHDCDGGALAYWPDGPDQPAATHEARYNTAMVLDTDTVFHGVDRIASVAADDLPPLRPGMVLDPARAEQWTVHFPDHDPVATYDWDDLRFSVSWKAYCFHDDAERDAWRAHADDLTVDAVVDRLVADLRERGRVQGEPARTPELGLLMIDEYIHFPMG
jgi:hypothetical protein